MAERTLRWLITLLVGAGGLGVTWWLAEDVFGQDRPTAVAIATMAGPLLATPFGWWAGQNISSPDRRWGWSSMPRASSGTEYSVGHVFVSFSHRQDSRYARRLAAYLTGAGVSVWFDQEIITGHRWATVIREHIDTCAAFIVVMTPEAEESDWVGREITRAEKKGKPILPLLLRGDPFFSLANLQYESVPDGAMPGPQFIDRLRNLTTTSSEITVPAATVATPGTPTAETTTPTRPTSPATGGGRDAAEVLDRSYGQGLELHTPAREIRNRRRLIRSTAGARLRLRLSLASGLAATILAVAGVPFLIGPSHATNTGLADLTPTTCGSCPEQTADRGGSPTRANRVRTPLVTLTDHSNWVEALAFSPNGRTLASASADNTVKLWNVSDPGFPAVASTITGHRVEAVTFSPDGRILATANVDGTVNLWSVSYPGHPALSATINVDSDGVDAVAFSPNGHILATSDSHLAEIKFWNVNDPEHPTFTGALFEEAIAMVFSPNGRLLATSSYQSTVELSDVSDPAHPSITATITGHRSAVGAVAFSPNGRTLATASSDSTAKIWDISDPAHPAYTAAITGHIDEYAVAFSPDGRTLATTSSDDYTVSLWAVNDLSHPTLATTLIGHSRTVHTLAFSPNGRTLATGSRDNTIKLWQWN